jgi:hypothetical protein
VAGPAIRLPDNEMKVKATVDSSNFYARMAVSLFKSDTSCLPTSNITHGLERSLRLSQRLSENFSRSLSVRKSWQVCAHNSNCDPALDNFPQYQHDNRSSQRPPTSPSFSPTSRTILSNQPRWTRQAKFPSSSSKSPECSAEQVCKMRHRTYKISRALNS